MTDPFGALATQRIGDLGVHIGQGSWAGTSQQSNVTAVFGTGSDTFGGYPNAKLTQFYDGTTSQPQTHETPSVKIFRTEKITSPSHNGDPGYSAALSVQVNSLVGNKNQSQAIWGQASGETFNNGYVIGGYFTGIQSTGVAGGTGLVGGANGIFALAKTSVATGNAWVIATETYNDTGASSAYSAAGNQFTIVDAVYNSSGANYGGAAFQVRGSDATRTFDAGYSVLTGGARTYGFIDSSSSTYGMFLGTDHAGAGIYILNDNAAHYAQIWQRASATAGNYGLTISAAGAIGIDEIGVAQKLYITKGTPGANLTCLSIQEGAGPTLRRLTTFDPGAAGINLTAGQLVCVLV